MRLFLAVEIPGSLERALAALHTDEPVRWTRPESLHLTLRFLGQVEPKAIEALTRAIEWVTTQHEPFALELAGGGAFPRSGPPRVLWVGVRGEVDALASLVHDLEEAVEDLGFAAERRRFSPHVTIGRVRRGRPSRALARLRQLGRIGALGVSEVILFESRLHPEGAEHLPLRRFPLG